MSDLNENFTDELALAPYSELDMVSSVDVHLFDNMLWAKSMSWEFDLKRLWLTRSRWNTMVKQYLDPAEVIEWLDKIESKLKQNGKRGIATLRTQKVKTRVSGGTRVKESRRWGSCMLSVSYRNLPKPQITLHSRSSYLGYLSALDLSVAWHLGNMVAAVRGINVEDMRFLWFLEDAQVHNFKSTAHLLSHPEPDKQEMYRRILTGREKDLHPADVDRMDWTPMLKLSRQWIQKLIKQDKKGEDYDKTKYSTYRRVRRRYHTEVLGYEHAQQFATKENRAFPPLPSVMAKDLDFSAIGL